MAEMQGFKARVEYEVTDGTQLLYTFPFSYLRKKFIKVDVLHADNSITTLTYGVDYVVNDLSLTLTNPAKVGEHLIIYRQTTTDKIITWNDGSILLASDMNTEDVQMLHLQEEQQDYIQSHSINTKTDSATKEVLWDALNHRVINVSDPKDPQDVVTKAYMESVQGGFVAANTKILNDAKATLSATQQTQSKAQANETLSKAWAESTESPDGEDDSLSTTGKTKSAKGWAEQAKSYAGALNMSFILNTLLPIGTVYMTENANFDPNTYWGVGTWGKTAINRVLQGTNEAAKVGTTIDAGLPNITGNSPVSPLGWKGWNNNKNGALSTYVTEVPGRNIYQNAQSSEWGDTRVYIDASNSNPIYGSSDTVQPPAELVFIWKRIA